MYFIDVPVLLYVSMGYSCVLYPVFCLFISCKLKEMIVILKFNKDLIHTIQTILQVFPECVIIRSLDEKSKETIMKFANNIASKVLIEEKQEENDQNKRVRIEIVNSENINNNEENAISLDEFLYQQEHKFEFDHSDFVENMVKVKEIINKVREEFVRNIENNKEIIETFFNVKTIKVNWENNEESFMHVFVNTTQVKKLEEERLNREYQHMMFASLSHELRTPLNAFSNSLYLIKFTFDEIKSHIDKSNELENSESLYTRIYKFIKIGEVSSCLLMNLVDDILDMSKFEAKTFQLNIDRFKLFDLLKDIDYIFGFQCAEKHLDFKIKCSHSIANKIYRSDQKRIKQVLINLISNSFKFTERGSIKVKISEFERHNDRFLRFEVCDSGVGISQQDIPKLFKMFGMLSKHRNQLNKSGSGLGLSISKRIVESLGGKIKVSSHENEWTKFTFTIKNADENNSIDSESNDIIFQNINSIQEEEKDYQVGNQEICNDASVSQVEDDALMSEMIQKDILGYHNREMFQVHFKNIMDTNNIVSRRIFNKNIEE